MPRKTENYIRLDAPGEAGKHEGHELRTRTFSKKDGIKALYCIQCKKHTVYLFSRKPPWNWTMSRAQAWIKKHKKASFVDLSEDGGVIFRNFDEHGALMNEYGLSDIAEAVSPEKSDVDKSFAQERVIFLFSGIYEYTSESVIKKLLYYDKLDSKTPIKIVMSSFGGSVYASFAIIDAMEYVQAPVETIGIGNIMSGGLMIFMAGDKRYISQSTGILSHRFRTMKIGTQAELKADRKEDDLVHKRIVNHYIKFSNLETEGEVLAKLLQETNVWLTPEEAMSFGLADDYFDKDWVGEEDEGGESQTAVTFICECIKCGHTITTAKHCDTLKCSECGGQMRRKGRPGPGQEAFFGEAEKEIPMKDSDYLLHHVITEDGKEKIHHCLIYDHIANLFEHDHLLIKDGKVYLDGKLIKDGLFHIIKGLEPSQEVVWSGAEAKENKIKPKTMKSGMTLKEKAKEW